MSSGQLVLEVLWFRLFKSHLWEQQVRDTLGIGHLREAIGTLNVS